jgi:hypothetical protein
MRRGDARSAPPCAIAAMGDSIWTIEDDATCFTHSFLKTMLLNTGLTRDDAPGGK